MTTAMFARLAGPVNESSLPYTSATKPSHIDGVISNASDYLSIGACSTGCGAKIFTASGGEEVAQVGFYTKGYAGEYYEAKLTAEGSGPITLSASALPFQE